MPNILLEQIKRLYPQDTNDDILDWYEAALETGVFPTVYTYTTYRENR